MKITEQKKEASILLGIMFAFGFPAIAWAFLGWKWALVVFVLLQTFIGLAKLFSKN